MAKIAVAPLVGAWIEISDLFGLFSPPQVAPLVGAWIEIRKSDIFLPMSEHVAPLVGAWIEIPDFTHPQQPEFCRSPRGSVD